MPFDNAPTPVSTLEIEAGLVPDSEGTRFLRRAWALIDHPDKWCTGVFTMRRPVPQRMLYAASWYDFEKDPVVTMITHSVVTAYCSAGALQEALGQCPTVQWRGTNALRDAQKCLFDALPPGWRRRPDSHVSIVDYNDQHQWPAVKKWWQRAIDLSVHRDMIGVHK